MDMKDDKKKPDKKSPKHKEKLSRRDLENLMNIHADRYKRVNGAWRRK